MSELTIEIRADIWQKNRHVLIDARENAIELLNLNDNKLGIERHQAIAAMYEKEIEAIDSLLAYLP